MAASRYPVDDERALAEDRKTQHERSTDASSHKVQRQRTFWPRVGICLWQTTILVAWATMLRLEGTCRAPQ